MIIDEIILEKNSKGVTMLEIEYLKNDIEKLLQLLGSVPEVNSLFLNSFLSFYDNIHIFLGFNALLR